MSFDTKDWVSACAGTTKTYNRFGMGKNNPHTRSGFDDFLKEEDIFKEVQANARQRALAARDEVSTAWTGL